LCGLAVFCFKLKKMQQTSQSKITDLFNSSRSLISSLPYAEADLHLPVNRIDPFDSVAVEKHRSSISISTDGDPLKLSPAPAIPPKPSEPSNTALLLQLQILQDKLLHFNAIKVQYYH
jgi:hypothetical protein